MKKLIPLAIYLLLVGRLLGQDGNNAAGKKTMAATAPDVQVVLELSDGSRVIGMPSADRLKIKTQYATLNFELSKSLTIEFSGINNVAKVGLQNGDVLNGQLVIREFALKTASGKVIVPISKVSNMWIRSGSIGGDYVNSLGMEFVLVPGTKVFFSIWDTRVRDYRPYAKVHPLKDPRWTNPGINQGEDHPVVMVSWTDAKDFCTWLTQKEREEEKIGQDQEYRLPSDKEWSAAVGGSKYPWGDRWPPPKGSGNYNAFFKPGDIESTSPVGTFKANQHGLYDMGGNVRQWCKDWYNPSGNPKQGGRIARGSSFADAATEASTSSYRAIIYPLTHSNMVGFRCVLAPLSASH